MLTKHNVCLFIKDEEHLEEMREFLESIGEEIEDDGTFKFDRLTEFNYLQNSLAEVFGDKWFCLDSHFLTEVTTEQFKKLLDTLPIKNPTH